MLDSDPPQTVGDGQFHITSSAGAVFAKLRSLARGNGLAIRDPAAQFVDEDELLLLRWIAQSQRVAGLRSPYRLDERLRKIIGDCGEILELAGLRLPLRGTAVASFYSASGIPAGRGVRGRRRRAEWSKNCGQIGLFRSGTEAERG